MKMKRRLLTVLATAALAAAATLTIFAASPKDEAAIRYLEQQPLPLDSIIMRLDALEPYGVSYEQVGGGLQMYYNGYPVTRMTYWDADTKPGPGYTFTSINPPSRPEPPSPCASAFPPPGMSTSNRASRAARRCGRSMAASFTTRSRAYGPIRTR